MFGVWLNLGNKRKQASVDAAGTASSSSSSGNHAFASVVEGEDLYKLDIENTIAKAIDDVKNGSFSELQKRSLALDRMKEKQIAAADRHRKQQILNINQMFEYEVEDAKAIYNVSIYLFIIWNDLFEFVFNHFSCNFGEQKAYQELQEQLFSELNDEKQRLIAIQRQLQNENDESKPNNNSRSLRSTVPISSDMDGAQKAGTRGRKRGTKAEPVPMSLNEAISEDSRR